jgi:hypothetical protein
MGRQDYCGLPAHAEKFREIRWIREHMAEKTKINKAIEFVQKTGNEVELARLHYLLTGEIPASDIIDRVFAGQREDGGWSPFWAKDYSSLDATCFRLAQAEHLGAFNSESSVVRALHFLKQRQSPDGSWEELEEVSEFAPPWAAPGDLASRLYLTANCAFWLAASGRSEEKVANAVAYLQLQLEMNGSLPGFMQTHWLAGGLWSLVNQHSKAERVFSYLSEKLPGLPASNLGWLLTTCQVAGVPSDHSLLYTARGLLESQQETDGSWMGDYGSPDVHTTLEAIRALSH